MRKWITDNWSSWRQDRLLGGVLRNSSYLFSSSSISMGLTSLQGLLAAALLSPAGYGTLGVIVLFVSSINRLFSFRMGEVVIKYAGQYLATGKKREAAGVVKAAMLAEGVTSIGAYIILVLLAPWAANVFVKDPLAAPLIHFYGLVILANLIFETSTAILQLGNHFRVQAVLNFVQSLITTLLILLAFWLRGNLGIILTAYLVGKVVLGLGQTVIALRHSPHILGNAWWKTSLKIVPEPRKLAGFAFSTNLSGTINLIVRDSEVLWVGLFFTTTQAGYYKFALAFMNLVLMPITPFIATTSPNVNRTIAQQDWSQLRHLLRRTSWIAAVWTAACGLGLVVVAPFFLMWFKNGAYLPSYPAMLILIIGYGLANIFYWNRPLLLALGHPNFPLKVTAIVGGLKTALMFMFVPMLGFLAQAALLSAYLVISVGLIVRYGLLELRKRSQSV